MIRWLLVIFIALLVFSILIPELRKLGVGRAPGDMRIKIFGRMLLLPFGSAVVLFLLFLLGAWLQDIIR